MAERRLGPVLQALSRGVSLEHRRWIPQVIHRHDDRESVASRLDRPVHARVFQGAEGFAWREINDVLDTIALPTELPIGQYTLSLAVVDASSTPILQLAIQGRTDGSWYPLSKIQVVK